MKSYVEQIVSALNFAWGELFDFPLQLIFKNQSPPDDDNELTLAAFPVLGFLVGGAVSLCSFLLSRMFNPHAGMIFFAVAAWLILCFKDSSRGDVWFGRFVSSKFMVQGNREFTSGVLNFLPVMLKFVLLLFIAIAGGIFFLPVLLMTAFALQAALASCDDCPPGFVNFGDYGVKVFHTTLIVLAVICFTFCQLATLGAAVAGIIAYISFVKYMQHNGFTAAAISKAGYIAEWILLLTGLLLV